MLLRWTRTHNLPLNLLCWTETVLQRLSVLIVMQLLFVLAHYRLYIDQYLKMFN